MDRIPHVETARPEDREAALRLIFQHLESADRQKRVANALHLMELGKLSPEGLFVIRDRQTVAGAMICLPIPGAGALVWPPRTVPSSLRNQVEDALIDQVRAWLRQRGAKLGQALLSKDEAILAAPLERNGYRHITTLRYLRCSGKLPLMSTRQSGLVWQPYDPQDSAVFARTLLRTYQGTRDCPEVNGVRTIDEILDGHKADAGCNLEHWWLASDADGPVGVLLVNESAEWEAWEVAYVGVVPEARGRGMGRQLMLKALTAAHEANVAQLTLCVDARNTPALRLYQELGFEPYDEREVYLAVWQPFSDA
jgi:ribosomal protein S18 acetylase RimI-like enzyme